MSRISEGSFRFEETEDGTYGIVAITGDVQVGWCRQQDGGWFLFDMDECFIGGPFSDLATAESESALLLVDLAGASNPGH